MRVPYQWLREYVEVELDPHELAELLTRIGLEVEEVSPAGKGLEQVLVGRISALRQHPEADHLYLCEVETGSASLHIVCGAPNCREGMLAPVAPPGTRLPDGTEVQSAVIRGESSQGVLLAEDELGLTEDHSGVMELPEGLEVGAPLPRVLPLEDWVLEVALTPNRADCASVVGIAREVAAATGKRLRRPKVAIREEGPDAEILTRVDIEDPEGCPRYVAGLIQGVRIGPSPFWMRYRLHLAGMRSINNLVDVTNYVMLELGQPLHAFDYHRLREHRIVVRRAREGEVLTTLDGVARTLNARHLLICDAERPVALAGIMGGLNSEIFAATQDVLLESACFDPATIRRGAKVLGLSTEASYRFERGVDIEGALGAARRALALMEELAGGKVARGVVDAYPRPHSPKVIILRVERANRFLGTELSSQTMADYLRRLEMPVRGLDETMLEVVPPSFRVDVSREVDLIEEVARLYGYDRIPVTVPQVRFREEPDPLSFRLRETIREVLVGFGFSEIITYGFINPASADRLSAGPESPLRSFVVLQNPLSVEQSVMRSSLAPGMLQTVQYNRQHGATDLRLFEWGKVFLARPGEELPEERTALAVAMSGSSAAPSWYDKGRPLDFYDLKGVAEGLLKALNIRDIRFVKGAPGPWYDPACSAALMAGQKPLGQMGRAARHVLEAWDLKGGEFYLLELDGEALLDAFTLERRFEPYPRFPPVYRDLSVVVPKALESAAIEAVIRREGGGWVESVQVFDLYEGKGIGASEKAIGFRVRYRSADRTLDGEEVNLRHEQVIRAVLKESGGRLREA